jgi:hypothetical protein
MSSVANLFLGIARHVEQSEKRKLVELGILLKFEVLIVVEYSSIIRPWGVILESSGYETKQENRSWCVWPKV